MKNGLMLWLVLVMMPLTATAKTYFVHPDQLGTPQVITDSNQNVVWKADYEPFGAATITTQTITNNLRFPGQYYDQETGLHYNYFRDYDPSIGRYIESDPSGLNGGINAYAYILGNPINLIDPFGLKPYKFTVDIGGGFGYIIVGGGTFTGEVEDINKGESCLYQIRCFGIGVGLPEINITTKPVEYDDGKECSECKDFEGTGYIGGGSFVLGVGVSIGGGVKFPNGPLVAGDYISYNYGGIRIGVGHSACYFRFIGKK